MALDLIHVYTRFLGKVSLFKLTYLFTKSIDTFIKLFILTFTDQTGKQHLEITTILH